ncbi:MAG TPA: tetratricopeptide repeat protein, partial [Syntrophorhabdaceae bacterium]|nr:tetratricopeptide repeat protein [Syntrophorhabdaceae bacterium]
TAFILRRLAIMLSILLMVSFCLGRIRIVRHESPFNKNSNEEARSLVTQAISADRSQPAFHTLNGFILLRKDQDSEARRSFQHALSIDPNYQPALRGMGVVEYFSRNYNQGIDYLRKGLTLFPEDIPSRYFLGVSYYKTASYRSAIEQLKEFAEAQPKHPRIHGILGECYERVGDLQSAYNEYTLQTQIDPNSEIGKYSATRASAIRSSVRQR